MHLNFKMRKLRPEVTLLMSGKAKIQTLASGFRINGFFFTTIKCLLHVSTTVNYVTMNNMSTYLVILTLVVLDISQSDFFSKPSKDLHVKFFKLGFPPHPPRKHQKSSFKLISYCELNYVLVFENAITFNSVLIMS